MAIPDFDMDKIKREQGNKAPVVKADLTGKVVVVTGANTGLGYEVAKHFAAMKPKRLILACRSESRGQAAVERLTKETGFTAAELWLLDQSSFASVKAFATKFNEQVDRLDILLQNAAIAPTAYSISEDGWDDGLQVNNLAPELLALLLLPKMILTKETYNTTPRLVVVASSVHEFAGISDDVVNGSDNLHKALSQKSYFETKPPSEAGYMVYKLLNVLFIRALKKRLPPSSIIVNSANPGYCDSELRRHATEEQKPMYAFLDTMAYTSEEGARHIVWPALADEAAAIPLDKYANVSEVLPVGEWVTTEIGAKAEKKLWEESIQILSEVDERVPGIVSKYLI